MISAIISSGCTLFPATDPASAAIFSKASRVLGHAELFEPIGNLLHGRKPPRDRAYGALDEDSLPWPKQRKT